MFLFQLSGLNKAENIRYVCELVSGIAGVPVFYLDSAGNILFQFSEEYNCAPPGSDLKERLRQLVLPVLKEGCPLIRTTDYIENFLLIEEIREQALKGTLVAGPSLPFPMASDAADTVIKELNVPQKLKPDLLRYYEKLPVVEYEQLIRISLLLYFIIYGKKLDSAAVVENNPSLLKLCDKMENEIHTALSKNRESALYHHTPLYEKYMLQYIKEGDREKLLDHLSKPSGGESGVLSRNPLRNRKNLFICSATVGARAAIEGGLNPELAFTISDLYIQRAEELNEIGAITSLYLKMICDFTERVRSLKSRNYSKAIHRCRNYIFKHLYGDITLSRLAEVAGLNANYLSELFRKETGMTVSDYIRRERVEEAKKLLSLTGDSILDICTSLNFADQSYFTKVFKKYTGVTPRQYREAGA